MQCVCHPMDYFVYLCLGGECGGQHLTYSEGLFSVCRLIHKLEDVSLGQEDRQSILSTQTLHRPLWNVAASYNINDTNMEINRMSWIDKDGVPIKYALDSYYIPL